jgi:hypothetical protein
MKKENIIFFLIANLQTIISRLKLKFILCCASGNNNSKAKEKRNTLRNNKIINSIRGN